LDSSDSTYFVNENTGWAVGRGGTILRTINGGANWSFQLSGTLNDLNSVAFFDANIGYIVGDKGIILATNDGGVKWVIQQSNTTINLRSPEKVITN
jgi:photosystem II stability/assembly factor-like uncharacterized protein